MRVPSGALTASRVIGTEVQNKNKDGKKKVTDYVFLAFPFVKDWIQEDILLLSWIIIVYYY